MGSMSPARYTAYNVAGGVAWAGLLVYAGFFFGGPSLHYFALALTVGICFGIYSSVLVACPLAMYLGASREDFVKPEKKAATNAMP